MESNMKFKYLIVAAGLFAASQAHANTIGNWSCGTEGSDYVISVYTSSSLSSSATIKFGGTNASSSFTVDGLFIKATIPSGTDCPSKTITVVDGATTYSVSD